MPKLTLTQSSKAHLMRTWGEDWQESQLPKRSSSISRMFFFWLVCLGPLIIYHLGVGGEQGGNILFPPPPFYGSVWLPPPDALLVTTGPTSLPPKKPKSRPPRKKRPPSPQTIYTCTAPFNPPLSPYLSKQGFFSLLSQMLEVSKSFPLTNKTFFRSVI